MTDSTTPEPDPNPFAGRNADGTFGSGNKFGKGAIPGKRWTWQCYADRVAHWRQYSRQAIREIFEDKPQFDKLPTRDCEIIEAIYNASTKNEKGERAFLLNREIGGEINRSEHTGAEGADLFGATKSVRSRLLSPTAVGGETAPVGGGDGDGSSST